MKKATSIVLNNFKNDSRVLKIEDKYIYEGVLL